MSSRLPSPLSSLGKKPPAKKAKFKPTAGGLGGGDNVEEAQRQAAAMETLTQYFPEVFYAMVERRKKRKIMLEEVPLKAQLFALQGLSHFLLFHQKMEFRDKLSENTNKIFAVTQVDNEWFSFPNCGTVIFGLTSKSEIAKKAVADQHSLSAAGPSNLSVALGGVSGRNRSRTLERAAAMATTGRVSQTKDLDRPPSGQTRGTMSPTREQTAQSQGGLSHREALELVSKMLDAFSRSIVLAHRGAHWILLQNTIISMSNSIVSIISSAGGILIDKERIQHLLCPAYCKAADCLLDMLVKLDDGFIPAKIPRNNKAILDVGVMQTEWMGDVRKDFGGSGLQFNKSFDDQSQVDKRLVKEIIFEAIELMFKEGRFEFLSDIALRFNAISRGMFAHLIDPFMVLSQRRLIEKVERHGGPKPTQPYFEAVERQIGKPITDLKYLNLQYRVFVNPSQVTRRSKKDTTQPKIQMDGNKVICVPLNLEERLFNFRSFVHNINYASLALQHARKLMQLYLSKTTAKDVEDLKKEAQERALKKQMSSIAEDAGPVEGKLVSGLKKEESTTRRSSKAGSVKTVTRQSTVKESDKKNAAKGAEADAKKKMGAKASEEEEAFRLEYDFEKIPTVSSVPMNPNIVNFTTTNDVVSLSLSYDHVNVVVDAYEKAITMLKAKGQESLVVEGLHELGNLYHFAKIPKLAYQSWAEALDLCCKQNDIIQLWNTIWNQEEDVPMQVLRRCGIWGSLLCGVLVVKIAKYLAKGNGVKQRELCLIASKFFKAALRTSLIHPISDLKYATYDIGIGAAGASDLLAGIDILGDKFRLDSRLIVGSLSWLSHELVKNKHFLVSLPILTLQSHFASHYCRDISECVESRLLKVRALSDSDLHAEAFFNLQLLLNGFRIPQLSSAVWRVSEGNPISFEFKNNQSILDIQNLKFLDYVMEKRMSPTITGLYGPQLTCKALITHAHALISLADTLNVFPAYEDIMSQMQDVGESERETPTLKPPVPPTQDKSGKIAVVQEETASEAGSETQLVNNPLSSGFKPVTFDLLKGYLLHTAELLLEGIFQTISDTINTLATKNNSKDEEIAKVQLPSLTVAELETLILCLQEMAAISLQNQHANRAARCIYMAMDQISKNKIFSHNINTLMLENIEPPSPGEVKSCSHVDNKLWVQLRLSLVQYLLLELKNFHGNDMENQQTLPSNLSKVSIVGDVKTHCTMGIEEADTVGDNELKAAFLFLAAQLALKEGQAVNQVQIGLSHSLTTLKGISDDQMSAFGTSLLPQALILSTDMSILEQSSDSNQTALLNYREAQNILLTKLCLQGEQLEEHEDNPDLSHLKSPLQNVHSKLLPLLIEAKMRIASTITSSPKSSSLVNETYLQEMVTSYAIFATIYNMNRVISSRQSDSEVELEGMLGITKGALAIQGHYGSTAGATSHLLRAITLASELEHNISFIRKMYLELALVFHCSSEIQSLPIPTAATPSVSMEDHNESEADPPVRLVSPKKSVLRLRAREKAAASVALRLATAAGIAQQERIKLFGKCKSSDFKRWNSQAQINIPEFIIVDLLSPILFDSKKTLNSSLEEEMALCDAEASSRDESTLLYRNDQDELEAARKAITKQLVKEEPPKEDEDSESNVEEANENTGSSGMIEKDPEFQISWIQILSYQAVVQRLNSFCLATQKKVDTKSTSIENAIQAGARKFSTVSISLPFKSSGQNCDAAPSQQQQIIDTPINNTPWHMRLRILHKFMMHNLPDYASSCLAPSPTKEFYFKVASESNMIAKNPSVARLVRNYDENLRLHEGEEDSGAAGVVIGSDGARLVRLENPIPGIFRLPAESSSAGSGVVAAESGTSAVSASSGALGVPTSSLPAAMGNELFLQWYRPQLSSFYDRYAKTRKKPNSLMIDAADRTFLLFTITTRIAKEGSSSTSASSISSASSTLKVKNGLMLVSISRLEALHRRIVVATHQFETVTLERQNAESLLSSKDSLQVPPATGKKKKGSKLTIKTGPTPLQRMEAELVQQLKRLVVETHALLDATIPETAAPKGSTSPGPGESGGGGGSGGAGGDASAAAASSGTPGAAESTDDLSSTSSTALKGAEDLPFAATIGNMQLLEKIFDPQLGGSVGDAGNNADVFKWISDLVATPPNNAASAGGGGGKTMAAGN